MKVLLVSTNREQSPYPVAPLGALCVAAAARAAGHQVEFLDLGLVSAPHRALRKALATNEYHAVAFSIRNLDNCFVLAPRSYFDDVRRLAETARRSFRGPLILGGSGFSVAPQGWMRRLEADYGVVGEGERVFAQLLGRLEAGLVPGELDGVIRAPVPGASKAGHLPEANGGTPAPAIEQLDDLAMPAHELCQDPEIPAARRMRQCANQTRVPVRVPLLQLSSVGGTALPPASGGSGGG